MGNQVAVRKVQYLGHDHVDIERLELGLALLEHVTQSMNDVACPLGRVDDVSKGLLDLRQILRVVRQQTASGLSVAQNHGKRLVDLVSKRTGQLHEHAHACQMGQLLPQRAKLVLDTLALRDVDTRADKPDGTVDFAAYRWSARQEPSHASIAVEHSMLDFEGGGLAAHTGACGLLDLLDILRMIVLHPSIPAACNLMALIAEQVFQVRMDEQGVGARVPFPDAD